MKRMLKIISLPLVYLSTHLAHFSKRYLPHKLSWPTYCLSCSDSSLTVTGIWLSFLCLFRLNWTHLSMASTCQTLVQLNEYTASLSLLSSVSLHFPYSYSDHVTLKESHKLFLFSTYFKHSLATFCSGRRFNTASSPCNYKHASVSILGKSIWYDSDYFAVSSNSQLNVLPAIFIRY